MSTIADFGLPAPFDEVHSSRPRFSPPASDPAMDEFKVTAGKLEEVVALAKEFTVGIERDPGSSVSKAE